MAFALNRVVNIEDFEEPMVRNAIRDVYRQQVARLPDLPSGHEHGKQGEVAMAVLALRHVGVWRFDAEVLGIGAGQEATSFWLTEHVGRVGATDLKADSKGSDTTAPSAMLTDPGRAWPGRWNPCRLVVQHMDTCELAYEDETFEAIFSSGSMRHFGSRARIAQSMDEAFRVLKTGGTRSVSTVFLIEGDALAYEQWLLRFTPELIQELIVGDRDGAPMTPIDYTVSSATRATETELDHVCTSGSCSSPRMQREPDETDLPHPHCVLRSEANVFRSVHLASQKAGRRAAPRTAGQLPAVSNAGMAFVPLGPGTSADASAPRAIGPSPNSAAAPTGPGSGRPRSPLRLLRTVAEQPYRPLVWRLNRNYYHGEVRAGAVDSHLAGLEARLEGVADALDDLRASNEHARARRAEADHALIQTRDLLGATNWALAATSPTVSALHESIVGWTALISRALGGDRDDRDDTIYGDDLK